MFFRQRFPCWLHLYGRQKQVSYDTTRKRTITTITKKNADETWLLNVFDKEDNLYEVDWIFLDVALCIKIKNKIMDYENKYKELVGKIDKAYLSAQTDSTKAVLEEIRPELKEDKDERIRRNIIAALKGEGYYDCDLKNECIAWVEKQEPKFHEGDWITDIEDHEAFLISKDLDNTFRTNVYRIISTDGEEFDIPKYSVEDDYRLWDITKDAKDGDVLVDENDNIGIFQKCKGICWYSYIYLGCDGEVRGFKIGGSHVQSETHPATKEQRDTLIKAMADAGCEFDFDKKELKKIDYEI